MDPGSHQSGDEASAQQCDGVDVPRVEPHFSNDPMGLSQHMGTEDNCGNNNQDTTDKGTLRPNNDSDGQDQPPKTEDNYAGSSSQNVAEDGTNKEDVDLGTKNDPDGLTKPPKTENNCAGSGSQNVTEDDTAKKDVDLGSKNDPDGRTQSPETEDNYAGNSNESLTENPDVRSLSTETEECSTDSRSSSISENETLSSYVDLNSISDEALETEGSSDEFNSDNEEINGVPQQPADVLNDYNADEELRAFIENGIVVIRPPTPEEVNDERPNGLRRVELIIDWQRNRNILNVYAVWDPARHGHFPPDGSSDESSDDEADSPTSSSRGFVADDEKKEPDHRPPQ